MLQKAKEKYTVGQPLSSTADRRFSSSQMSLRSLVPDLFRLFQ
ncbi:MAG: hypothetical protein SPF83_15280 [Butyricimonas virosa]|nr:hypothetical protein [Butyricimonas virosa]MDY5535016.1 hypothetical protein [Butyricimonas virosa]